MHLLHSCSAYPPRQSSFGEKSLYGLGSSTPVGVGGSRSYANEGPTSTQRDKPHIFRFFFFFQGHTHLCKQSFTDCATCIPGDGRGKFRLDTATITWNEFSRCYSTLLTLFIVVGGSLIVNGKEFFETSMVFSVSRCLSYRWRYNCRYNP